MVHARWRRGRFGVRQRVGRCRRRRHDSRRHRARRAQHRDGPRCASGSTGCWEAYISNRATLARYFGRDVEFTGPTAAESRAFSVEDLIARARAGDAKAITAIEATARYLGLGLASVVNATDPARIYIGGEITAAWDLIETPVRSAMAERALTPAAAATDIRPVDAGDYPRLRGAAALVVSPAYAAPVVA